MSTGWLYPAGSDPPGAVVGAWRFALENNEGAIHHAIAMGLVAEDKERAFDEQIIWALRDSGRIDDGIWRDLTSGDLYDQWQALYGGTLGGEATVPDTGQFLPAAFARYHSPGVVGRRNLLAGDQSNPLRPGLAEADRLDVARRFFEAMATSQAGLCQPDRVGR